MAVDDAHRNGDTLPSDGGPRVDTTAAAPGAVLLDRYELLTELGRGAHAVVFHAHDRAVGTDIAVKVLGRSRRLSPVATERLRRELRAAWTVTHPGVVRIHDLIIFSGQLALSMELVIGETLDQHIARGGKLSTPKLLELARDLASALAAAHTAGVTHRDLKPSNMMIRAATGRAVITDFGLSRMAGIADPTSDELGMAAIDEAELTRTGELLGTPAFMAPEQLRAGGPVGPAADVYAMGLVLFEAATGVRPHPQGTLAELVHARLERPTPSVSSLRPDLPAGLARVIDDCLVRDPAARIPDGKELDRRLGALTVANPRARWMWGGAVAAAIVATAAVAWWIAHRTHSLAVQTVAVPPLPAATFETFPDGPLKLALTIPGQTNAIVQRALRLPGGNLAIAGHTTTPFTMGGVAIPLRAGLQCGYVIALSPTGEVIWHREIAGEHQVHVVDMTESHGQLIVVGVNLGLVDLGGGVTLKPPPHAGFSDCFVAAFDERDGSARWASQCGATEFGQAHAVVADAAGNLYVDGWFLGEATFGGTIVHKLAGDGNGSFLVSLHADGSQRWVAASTDTAGSMHAMDLVQSGDELIMSGMVEGKTKFAGMDVVGDTDGDGFVLAVDATTGVPRTVRTFGKGGNLSVGAVAVGPAGELAIAGTFGSATELVPGQTVTATGNHDTFVAQLDPHDLHTIWAAFGGGGHYDGARDVAFLGSGDLIAVGRFAVDFDMAGRHLAGYGGDDAFVIALDPHGEVTALTGYGGADSDRPRNVSVDPDGLIRISGTFTNNVFRIAGHDIHASGRANGYVVELRKLP